MAKKHEQPAAQGDGGRPEKDSQPQQLFSDQAADHLTHRVVRVDNEDSPRHCLSNGEFFQMGQPRESVEEALNRFRMNRPRAFVAAPDFWECCCEDLDTAILVAHHSWHHQHGRHDVAKHLKEQIDPCKVGKR